MVVGYHVWVIFRWSPFLLFAALCGCSPDTNVSADYEAVLTAVLSYQPDMDEQYRLFIEDYPDQASYLDSFLDQRLCVVRETAGEEGDFERSESIPLDSPPNFDSYSDTWESSNFRANMPRDILPSHLRWDSYLSICPNGTIRFGNPVITQSNATVYVENTSRYHGWAGDIRLEKVEGKWVVRDTWPWWQN